MNGNAITNNALTMNFYATAQAIAQTIQTRATFVQIGTEVNIIKIESSITKILNKNKRVLERLKNENQHESQVR